jgi:hypothetical protein
MRAKLSSICLNLSLLSVILVFSPPAFGQPTQVNSQPPLDVAGKWVGNLVRGPYHEDWSFVVLEIKQNGTSLTGKVIDVGGNYTEVAGSVDNEKVELNVVGLPRSSTCGEHLIFAWQIERDKAGGLAALSGNVSGRCYGTVMGTFRLTRSLQVMRVFHRNPS